MKKTRWVVVLWFDGNGGSVPDAEIIVKDKREAEALIDSYDPEIYPDLVAYAQPE